MDIKKLTQEVLLKNMTPEQQLAVLDSVTASVKEAKAVQKQKIAENVDLVLQALKRIEADMLKRVEGSAQVVEDRVKTIKDGKDGKNGLDGKAGKDGINGKDGKDGRDGRDGLNGKAGERGQDGVGVQNAHIDFDGSLIIALTNGQELNVGEVVPFDIAEKIRVIGNGGGTSQYVVDTLASLQTQINAVSAGLIYKGTWNASTNTPSLASGTGTNGWYYVVSVAGSTNLNGVTDWQVGDWAIFNGSTWQKIDQTNLVTSVNGQTGAVTVGTVTSVGTGTGLSGGPITSSGTINFSNSAVGTWAATPSSANLAAAVSDETGSGALVFGTTPTLSAPTVGGTNPYVQFNNGSAVALAAGRLWYDGTTGSWNAGMGGGNITQQIGEELFIYGKASAAITDSPLQIVYQTGTVGASGVVTFGPTVAGITNGDLIIGAATESIALNGFGRITSFGVIHGVTTNGTAYGETWADGDTIWYNPVTGNPTNVKPVAPNIKVQIGILIKAGSGGSGSIQIEINHGSVLGGTDSNVQLTSPANNQILSYDGTAGYWKNVSALNGIPVGNTTASSGAFTTLTASSDPTFTSTGAVQLPSGTTAQQPTGVAGKLLFNTTTSQFEGYNGTTWASVGGAAISNDTATASYEYPLFASATTGTALTVYTSNAKYLYKPSTGELQASLVTATNGIHMNSQSISTSVTIPVGYSANSTGPITIASGQSVTVSSGSRWVVL